MKRKQEIAEVRLEFEAATGGRCDCDQEAIENQWSQEDWEKDDLPLHPTARSAAEGKDWV